jgi:hypothetical protein
LGTSGRAMNLERDARADGTLKVLRARDARRGVVLGLGVASCLTALDRIGLCFCSCPTLVRCISERARASIQQEQLSLLRASG